MASNKRFRRFIGISAAICVTSLALAACGGSGAESTGSTVTVTADTSPPASPTEATPEPSVESDEAFAVSLLLTDTDFDSVSAGAYEPFKSDLEVIQGPLALGAATKVVPEPCSALVDLSYVPEENASGPIAVYAIRRAEEVDLASDIAGVANSSVRVFETEADAQIAFSKVRLSAINCPAEYTVFSGTQENEYTIVYRTFIADDGTEVSNTDPGALSASTIWITRPTASYVTGIIGNRIWSVYATSPDSRSDSELARMRALIPLAQAAAARQ